MSTRMQFAWYALSLTGRGSLFGPPGLAYVLDLQPEAEPQFDLQPEAEPQKMWLVR